MPIYIFLNGNDFRLGKVKWNQYFHCCYIFVDAFLSQVSLVTAVFISLEDFAPSAGRLGTEYCPCERTSLAFLFPGHALVMRDLGSDNVTDCVWL